MNPRSGLLLGTENLQPRRLGSHVLFPPRWFSLHLGTGSLPSISSGLLQPLGKTAPRHRLASRVQLAADLPEHFRRATLQLIPTRSLASHFQGQRPLPQQELARQQRNLGFAHDHGHGSAHQPHIFHYTFICSEKTFTFPPHPVESSRQFRRQALGVQNVGDQPNVVLASSAPPRGSPGLATLACSCSRHRRSSTRTLPR